MYSNTFTEQDTISNDVLDSIFGTGADNVITPDEPENTVLKDYSPDKALDTVLPEKEKQDNEKAVKKEAEKTVVSKETLEVLDNAVTELSPEIPEAPAETEKGRPKTDKNALVSYIASKVDANEFGIPEDAPFDAKKQTLQQYLEALPEKELHTLLDSNLKAQIDEVRASTPKEFFDSLPEELQYAAAYVAEGGRDLRGLFKALSYVEEVKTLDPEKESDQEQIARSYLQATRFGTEEAITEQIQDWKDASKIEKKAKEFKPALDGMQKQQVEAQVRAEADRNKQRNELAQFYAQNVYNTLDKNELAGIKLDKKFIKDLGDNMTTTVPGPWSGNPVNYLGYGLEKSQYVEPDYEAVMLAAMILNDKAGTLEKIRAQGGTEAISKAAKLIKMNQGLGAPEQISIQEQKPVKRIANTRNVLKRIA